MHFVTITIVEWINILTKERYFEILGKSLDYCRKHLGLVLLEYVFMTNHIHLIIDSKDGFKISELIKSFKSHTTREFRKALETDNRRYIPRLLSTSYDKKKGTIFQIWKRENKPQVILSDEYLEKWTHYIWMNPVKAGYVELPEHWKWSSANDRLTINRGPVELDEYEDF
ncbi:MAG: transposase [Candidatus Gracilibacteria bacterium]|nr:transposase [Candidatus Gracilibacteria bacterium]